MTSEKTQRIFNSVNEKVQTLIKPDRFYIALFDPRRSRIEFPWVVDKGERKPSWETRDLDKTKILDQVILRGSVIHYERDVAVQFQSSKLTYWPEGEIPASWLGVPVVFEGKTLGAMIAESHTPGAFDQRAASLLATIAGQTATAIERARLDENLERRLKYLQAVQNFGQEINSAITLNESQILDLIYKQASKLMDTENMYIALYDRDGNMVRFPLMFVDGVATEVPPRKFGSGRTEHIISTKKSLFIETREKSVEWYKQQGRVEYIKEPFASWIGIPMISQDKVVGVIATYHKTDDYVYGQDDLEVLKTIANHSAIALDNSRLFIDNNNLLKQEIKRTEQLEDLQKTSIEITSQYDLKILLDEIAIYANKIMSADFTTLFFYSSEKEEFQIGTRKGSVRQSVALPTNLSYVYSIAQNGEAIFYDGLSIERKYPTVKVDGRESKAFAGLPLKYGDHVVGILLVNYFEPHPFSELEREIIQLLANQAAIAIENVKLIDDLKQAQIKIAEKESMLNRTSIAADFVHRLNNLAGTIPAWVGLVREGLVQTPLPMEEISDYLDKIWRDANDLLRAAEQLNDMPRKQQVDVVFVLQSMLRQIRIQYRKYITVSDAIQSESYKVYAVPFALTGALSSIVSNGIDAMMEVDGGTLTVNAYNDLDQTGKQGIHIEIKDTGPGIQPEFMDKLFIPFVSTKGKGRGYGLWRAKTVIEELGGSIQVKSAPSNGATFILWLPKSSEEESNVTQ